MRQPLIIGYLFAGFALSLLGVVPSEPLSALSKIGVTLLLFLVGIEMNMSELPSIGKVALIVGLTQIFFSSTLGFLLATMLGFGVLPAIYIAVALTFSSTIVVIKLLSEKEDLGSLYGRIVVAILLVQDLVAMVIVMFLASLGSVEFGPNYLLVAVKGIALIFAIWFLSRKLLPAFFARVVDQSTELIFVVSIAWALAIAAFTAGPLGFSLEIGGFLAGLALSNLPDHLQIATRTRPLRDFFLTIFFLLLGTSLSVSELGNYIVPILVFSVFVLIGKPFIVLTIMGLMGHRKKTGFTTGVSLAQISEFSLILMAMGALLGHVTGGDVSMVIIVGVTTMALSAYLIVGADSVYGRVEKILGLFERNKKYEVVLPHTQLKKDHVVLVGSHRTGRGLMALLKKKKQDFVVVDFNPELADSLIQKSVPVVFGDISEEDILKAANVSGAKLVISTIANLHDNLALLSYIHSQKHAPLTIVKARSPKDAITLYRNGATYVIVPEVLAGEHIRHILKSYGTGEHMKGLGKSHLKRLVKKGV